MCMIMHVCYGVIVRVYDHACVLLGTGSQNYKCQKYVIIVLNNAGLAITSKIKQTRSFYVS